MRASLLACVALTLAACVSNPATDAGCLTYGAQRVHMPRLSDDAVGRWVDVTDAAMTAACR